MPDMPQPSATLTCVDCGMKTTAIEANLRNFNQGRCGHCNGGLSRDGELFPRNRTHTRDDF